MIYHKIRYLLAEIIGTDDSIITKKTKFTKEYGIDDIDFAQLIINIEKYFDISINDDEAATFQSVGDIVEYVCRII